MKRFIAAIQFITILPVGKPGVFEPVGMIPFFPLVGLILGGMLCGFDLLVSQLWSPPVVAVLDVVFLVIVTGALHVDGLGDAADGLLGYRSRERTLEIMKDSRIGVMGLAAIVCCLAVKWGGIAGLAQDRWLLLLIVPAYARAGMLFGIRSLPYGRPDGGTGHDLFDRPLKTIDFWGLLLPMGISVLLGLKAVWLLLGFCALTALLLRYYRKRLGCITGDMLGTMTEILEAMLFLLMSMGGLQ